MLTDEFKAKVLEQVFPASYPWPHPTHHISLHSSYSAVGGNELSGGDPPYQRMPMTWFGASFALPYIRGQQASFAAGRFLQVPAGSFIRFAGLWDALQGGNFMGMFPFGSLLNNVFPHQGWDGNPPQTFVIDETPNSLVRCAHNLFYVGIQTGEFLGEFGVQNLEVVYWSASRYYNTMPEMTHGEAFAVTDISEHNFRLMAPGDTTPRVWNQTGFGFFQMSQLLYTPVQAALNGIELTISMLGANRNGAA